MKLTARLILTLTYLTLLSSCAWLFSSSSNSNYKSPQHKAKNTLPKVPSMHIPMGLTNNWHYLATTKDNNIIIELDALSVKPITTNIYQFVERKTIKNPLKNQFNIDNNASQIPQYKYLINTWQINCNTKEYKLIASKSYNKSGSILDSQSYSSPLDNNWTEINSNTIAWMQYKYVCLHINQDLGY